jgi:dipeptidyl aminopeptidase/acylaminoacyl peptidase
MLAFPRWARHAPDRLVVASNESGSWQLYAWDRAGGTRRQATDIPIGIRDGTLTPDGADVVWFDDRTGDERGQWLAEPFDGNGPARPLADGVPDAWTSGLAIGDQTVVAGTGAEDGFRIYVAPRGGPAREIHHHPELVVVAGLSRDGSLLCYQHAEHGDSVHQALRVVDVQTLEVAGEQWDGEGLGLDAAGWSPVPGDLRLAIEHERTGHTRPGVWNLSTGERADIDVDLPGEVHVEDWWPDGSALLLLHEHDGRSELYRADPDDPSTLSRVPHSTGTISGARVRPDGDVWFRVGSGAHAPSVRRSSDGDVVVSADGERAPDGRPYRSWEFTNPEGRRIHGFVVTPPGRGPFPLIMDVHGGPTWAYTDTFMPYAQAWVDHGFAVAMVNYRGSTGYGSEFRDLLLGNPGLPEVQDVHAGLDALIAEGVADPARCVVAGASWGGYITLMSIGLHPDRWAAAVAAVPVADYPVAFADEAPGLQAFDKTLFGGTPEELPKLYVERSPLTHIESVRTPVLILAGDNDTRCPIRQILNYVDRLQSLGREFELYRFDAGHGSMVIDEQLRQMAAELAFVTARVAV